MLILIAVWPVGRKWGARISFVLQSLFQYVNSTGDFTLNEVCAFTLFDFDRRVLGRPDSVHPVVRSVCAVVHNPRKTLEYVHISRASAAFRARNRSAVVRLLRSRRSPLQRRARRVELCLCGQKQHIHAVQNGCRLTDSRSHNAGQSSLICTAKYHKVCCTVVSLKFWQSKDSCVQ